MLNDFITIDFLFTFGGLVLILGIIVQFTKSLIKQVYDDYAVRWYAFGWAIVLTLLAAWLKGQFDVVGREIAATLLLVLLNSILITMAAIGGYEALADPRAEKTKQ
jgi:hypothetical protein